MIATITPFGLASIYDKEAPGGMGVAFVKLLKESSIDFNAGAGLVKFYVGETNAGGGGAQKEGASQRYFWKVEMQATHLIRVLQTSAKAQIAKAMKVDVSSLPEDGSYSCATAQAMSIVAKMMYPTDKVVQSGTAYILGPDDVVKLLMLSQEFQNAMWAEAQKPVPSDQWNLTGRTYAGGFTPAIAAPPTGGAFVKPTLATKCEAKDVVVIGDQGTGGGASVAGGGGEEIEVAEKGMSGWTMLAIGGAALFAVYIGYRVIRS